MSKLKPIIKAVKSKYEIDFNKISYFKLKEEALQWYMKDEKRSYILDIMADIKEILNDKSGDRDDKKFYVKTLLDLIVI